MQSAAFHPGAFGPDGAGTGATSLTRRVRTKSHNILVLSAVLSDFVHSQEGKRKTEPCAILFTSESAKSTSTAAEY